MEKIVKILGIIILIYTFVFYPIPLYNSFVDLFRGFNVFRVPTFWNNVILFPLLLFLGYGLYKVRNIARVIMIWCSAFALLINVPGIQALVQGSVPYKFSDLPLGYWIERGGLLIIALASLIILNLPPVKILFKNK